MVEAGIVIVRSGKVRLLSRDELPAAALLARLDSEGEISRDLAYWLYSNP